MKKTINIKGLILSFLFITMLFSCKNSESFNSIDDTTATFGLNAKGSIPIQLKNEMHIGLFESQGTWMSESGVPWNSRYIYLVNGWADNWGSQPFDGSIALNFMNSSAKIGAVPVFEYYTLTFMGGTEDGFLTKTKNASLMKRYFEDYKLLLQKIKEFGQPVVVLIEADGFAVLEIQSENNPNIYAAIEDSEMPELAGLPNTLAGWGLAFLELKKQLGVENVSLGMHISGWATGADLFYFNYELPLQPEVDKAYNFLAPLGLTKNQTGLEYDFLVGDPLDRDADFYQIDLNQDRWWDVSPTAGINSKSFNRYAEWLKLWNIKSEKRWILWQIALGNKNHLNVPNTGKPREGYKDNRVEYFLGENSATNLAKFADCGVCALLFGVGANAQSDFYNDYDENGDLYMKKRAKKFYDAGGMILKR